MNGRILSIAGLLVMTWGAGAATIGRWDFNSTPPDTSATTGTTLPAVGSGDGSLVGGVAGTFAAGSNGDSAADNSGWSITGFPAAGVGNKTAGVEFRASTRGYSNVVVSWDQRISGSASRYFRLQYSANGLDFMDAAVVHLRSNNTFYGQSVSLTSAAGVDDNPNFTFRIVAEFESTATGSGPAAYTTPLGASYSGSGTVRFDVVEIAGAPIRPENTPPTLEPVPDLVTVENEPIVGYPIEVGDDATPADGIRLRVSSSNTNLIPTDQVILNGTGSTREMTITPRDGQYGQSVITLTASDAESLTTSVAFTVTVAPLNAPPTVSPIPHQRQVMGEASQPVAFVVGDVETAPGALVVTAASSNPELVASSDWILGGAGADRWLQINPANGVAGTALITLRVEDGGGRSATTAFTLMVVPSDGARLWETFAYANGSLVTNSAGLWATHGGATGQVQVVETGLLLGSSRTEDIHVSLPGGASEAGLIYVSFSARFSALPSGNEYFAHLNHASGFRARVFAGTNNAARGFFRLGIGNGGAGGIGQAPVDLSLDTPYTVVVRYDVASATSRLWVNPQSESDPAAMATDGTSAVPIQSFSFRNNSGIGTMRIDNLRVGQTFADIGNSPGVKLDVAVAAGGIEVSWPASAGAHLQSNPAPSPVGWIDEPAVPSLIGNRLVVRLPVSGGQRFFRLIQ